MPNYNPNRIRNNNTPNGNAQAVVIPNFPPTMCLISIDGEDKEVRKSFFSKCKLAKGSKFKNEDGMFIISDIIKEVSGKTRYYLKPTSPS